MENGRYGCIQRDKNSVKNMIKIVDCWLNKKERPLKFRREVEKPKSTKSLKGANPKKLASSSTKPKSKATAKEAGAITSVHL